jgi:predicted nucleic-acid-binding Zn-ribbon protein
MKKNNNKISDLVVIRRYDQAHLAHLDRAKLSDEGIESFLKDENTVSINPIWSNAVGGIKLIVHKSDIERVSSVLGTNEYSDLQNAFNDKIETQNVCPKCGSTEVQQKRSFLSGIAFLILFFIPLAAPTNKYLCTSCSHTWKIK